MRKSVILLALAVVFAAADIVTKQLAFANLPSPHYGVPGGERVIIPRFLSLQLAENPGGLFGLGTGHTEFFILFSVVTMGLVAWMYVSFGHRQLITIVALSLILGGALGNLWDRLLYGSVRDFILLYIGPKRWPNFNVADVWICAGVIVLVGWLWRHPEAGKKRPADADASDQRGPQAA